MKTPSYWNKKNLQSVVLWPLGCLYNLATKLNIKFSHPRSVNKPVICIGNLTAGGTGKTPVAVSLAEITQFLGKKTFFVSRGYGGKLKDVIVDNKKHSAAEVGDEPLLLSRRAQVVVNPNRWQGACKAVENGADLIIMDDGFQNPGLKKDLSFLVFDGGFGYGNGWGIPAGPLRESLSDGLKRAQAIIIIGKDKHNLAEEFNFLPVFKGSIAPKPLKINNPNATTVPKIKKIPNAVQLFRCIICLSPCRNARDTIGNITVAIATPTTLGTLINVCTDPVAIPYNSVACATPLLFKALTT